MHFANCAALSAVLFTTLTQNSCSYKTVPIKKCKFGFVFSGQICKIDQVAIFIDPLLL